MSPLLRVLTRAIPSAGLAALGWSVVAQAQTPTVFNACVTPLTGLLYQWKEPGKCFLPSHRPISWTDGAGAILTGSTANGDLDGTYPNPKVDGLRGRSVADLAPTTNQILSWNGTAWAPKDPSGGGAVGTAGGALTGTYPNPGLANDAVTTASLANASVTEAKLAFDPATQVELDAATATAAAGDVTLQTNINTVSDALTTYKTLLGNSGGTANAAGNPLSWTQLKDVPSGVISGGGASGVAGGDLSGNYPNPAVVKLQGTAVSSTVPTNGQVLAFNGTSWAPAESPTGGSSTTGQNSVSVSGTAGIAMTPTSGRVTIPGLSATIDVPENSVTIISTDGGISNLNPATNGFSVVPIRIIIDGAVPAAGGYRLVIAANTTGIQGMIANWSMQLSVQLTPGSHTILVTAEGGFTGDNAKVSAEPGPASALRGTLTVTTLKR